MVYSVYFYLTALLYLVSTSNVFGQDPSWRFEEIRRFKAPEAVQAVAVDDSAFYAIGNQVIAKYDKFTGARLVRWAGSEDGPILHLNSGVIIDNLLYCAHSNYPGLPMVSSVEIWDTNDLRHVATHSFGIFAGSGTWIDQYDEHWWVAFAHYGGRGGEPGKGPEWTTLFRFDRNWLPRGSWVFPDTLIAHFAPYSSSGGAWSTDGMLTVTGHDQKEVYRINIPEAGSVLEFTDTIPISTPGQGIAWDKSQEGILYSIDRSRREVVVSRLIR